MLSDKSTLRRIPHALDPKQALFVDGIRHAIEIMDLAYGRLRQTLTELALNPPTSATLPNVAPYAFLDAWAMVDAIDRFRMLYLQMPGITFGPAMPGEVSLQEATQPFRDLRNVADHLAQRAEFVVSRDGAALGTLTWLTGFDVDPPHLWFCTLRPGTVRMPPELSKAALTTTIDWPTDRICLSAGGYEGNLSAVRPQIARRVQHFENELKALFERPELQGSPYASDIFLRQPYTLAPGQFRGKADA